jgi:transmembrane sensor
MADTARLWAIRVGEPAFNDWDGFTAWLEADAAHLVAYESALDTVAWAGRVLASSPRAANEDEPAGEASGSRGRWWGLGGALAACLAAAGAWTVYGPHGGQTIAVPYGQHRTVALADGSRVILNGGTTIVLDKDAPRRVELADGEALFEIHHNPADPFVVAVGKTDLIDVGTTFNVVSDRGALDVDVAKGAVVYRLGAQNIRLDAGKGLSRAGANAQPVLTAAAPGTVGNWQDGFLQYDNAPLDRVARDLGRNLGLRITAAKGAERMRFTGTLVINGSRTQVFERAGALLGVQFEQQGDGWRVIPTHDTGR